MTTISVTPDITTVNEAVEQELEREKDPATDSTEQTTRRSGRIRMPRMMDDFVYI